jgi:hypothetical protein
MERLQSDARALGVSPSEYARGLLSEALRASAEKPLPTWEEIVGPIRDQAEGITEEEVVELVERARTRLYGPKPSARRKGKHAKSNSKVRA